MKTIISVRKTFKTNQGAVAFNHTATPCINTVITRLLLFVINADVFVRILVIYRVPRGVGHNRKTAATRVIIESNGISVAERAERYSDETVPTQKTFILVRAHHPVVKPDFRQVTATEMQTYFSSVGVANRNKIGRVFYRPLFRFYVYANDLKLRSLLRCVTMP